MSNVDAVKVEHLLEMGRLDEARDALGPLLGDAPTDPQLLFLAARITLASGDLEEGRRQLESVLGRAPEHFGARYLLYRVEEREKNHAEAEAIITQLIREYPDDSDLIAEYADLMITTLHLEKARALTDEALRLEPENRQARLIDVLLSTIEGQRDRAGTQLGELVHEDPQAREIAFTLLTSLAEQGRNRDALELCQELLRSEPHNEGLIEAAITLRAQDHWLAAPLWPLQKFGWGASAAIWLVAIMGFRALAKTENPWVLTALGVYLAWVLYTWLYTPIMTRWIRARGI